MSMFAVVPIFTSAGVALLPTVMAALASMAAILLKPRELMRLVRRRPLAFGVAVAAIALGLATAWAWASGPSPRGAAVAGIGATSHFDWAKVAEEIIAQQRSGKAPTEPMTAAPVKAPLVLGRDYARCAYEGGTAPLRLKTEWNYRPEETMFLSSPVVAGNRIFAAGCQADLGNYSGLLACIDAESGKPLWQITQVAGEDLRPFFSSPALTRDGKYLVIGQGLHSDRDCSLLCFDTASGQMRWALKTPLHVESSPAIFGNMAVVGAGAIEGSDGKAVGDPGFVVAVRIDDGKELWRQPVNDPESSPAIDEDGIVYIGSGCNGNAVVAIRSEPDDQLRDKKAPRIAWQTSVSQPVLGAVTLAGDLVVAGAGNGDVVHSNRHAHGLVIALDRKTGAIRWQTPLEDAVLGTIAFREGALICPSRTGEVAALAANDGRILWRVRISGKAPVLAGCAFTGGTVYAVSSDGYLTVIDFKEGKILERIYLNDQAKPGTGLTLSLPQLFGGRVIVGSETGGLHCLQGSESAK
jgi:outer membrane protein assembly factor BamB